jgi:hypothetical protein
MTSENAGGGARGGRGGFGGGATEGKIGKDGTAVVTFPGRDSTSQAVFKGEKSAIETQDGWRSRAELESDDQGPGRFLVFRLTGFTAPAAQIGELLKATESVAMADGAYAGKMSAAGAKEMLSFRGFRRGGDGPDISNPSGSVKFWIKDGAVSKYQYSVKGTMSFNGNDRDIDRTTTVEISNVGSTTVEVPAGAKGKI